MGRWQNETNWPIIKPPAEQGWAPLPVKGNLRAFPRQGKQDLSNTGSQGPAGFSPQRQTLKCIHLSGISVFKDYGRFSDEGICFGC